METHTLPTAMTVRAAIEERVAQLSLNIEVLETTKQAFRERQGKRIDKRLALLMGEMIKPIAAAHNVHIRPIVKKRENYVPKARNEYEVRWLQPRYKDEMLLDAPHAYIQQDYSLEEVEDMYQHSVHPDAMRHRLMALRAYLDAPNVVEAAVLRYRNAAQELAAAAHAAGPVDIGYASNGQLPTKWYTTGVMYPVSTLFPAVAFSEPRASKAT